MGIYLELFKNYESLEEQMLLKFEMPSWKSKEVPKWVKCILEPPLFWAPQSFKPMLRWALRVDDFGF